MTTMKAAMVMEDGLVLNKTQPIPKRTKSEALIRVLRVGICNTDLEILKGYMGFKGVLGHEFIGRVVEIDENPRKIKTGDRVVGEINLAAKDCQCPACKEGGVSRRNHCHNRTVLGILNKHGTFAEYITLPGENLIVVDDAITDERAVFAEPLAAAFRVVEQNLVGANDRVAVIGDGKLGLLICMAISQSPNHGITLIGKHAGKMNLLLDSPHENVIADGTTAAKYEDKFDVCVEASGTPSGIKLASSITRPLGTVVLKSTCALSTDFNTAPFVIKELKVIGSRCGNFEMALEALGTNTCPVENLITHVYPFADLLQAIEHAGRKGTMKIQVYMENV